MSGLPTADPSHAGLAAEAPTKRADALFRAHIGPRAGQPRGAGGAAGSVFRRAGAERDLGLALPDHLCAPLTARWRPPTHAPRRRARDALQLVDRRCDHRAHLDASLPLRGHRQPGGPARTSLVPLVRSAQRARAHERPRTGPRGTQALGAARRHAVRRRRAPSHGETRPSRTRAAGTPSWSGSCGSSRTATWATCRVRARRPHGC
jgi:hypothetical protein